MAVPPRAMWVALVLCVAMAGIGHRWLSGQPGGKGLTTATLGHPRVGIAVLKVSAGSNHLLTLGPWPVLDPVRKRFPKMQPLLGRPTEEVRVDGFTPRLAVFFEPEDTSRGFESDRIFDGLIGVQMVDDHGCALGTLSPPNPYPVHDRMVRVAELDHFPRRQRSFKVEFLFDPVVGIDGRIGGVITGAVTRILDLSAGQPSNRIPVVNPRPWTGKEWVPEQVPAIREAGDLRVEFLGWAGEPRLPEPKFRHIEGGRVSTAWEVRWLSFSDVTGNQGSAWELCRFEPAWRCSLGLLRTTASVVDSTSVGGWPTGPRPAPAVAVGVGRALEIRGVPVVLVAHGGPGVFRFDRRGAWECTGSSGLEGNPEFPHIESGRGPLGHWAKYHSSRSWIALQHMGPGPDLALSIAAVDPAGRHHPAWPGMTPEGTLWFHEVPLPPDVTQVAWKLVIQPMRKFEFTVPPPPPMPGTHRTGTAGEGKGK